MYGTSVSIDSFNRVLHVDDSVNLDFNLFTTLFFCNLKM